MSNRIDQLFKEKLSDHKVAPSAEAWTKVQSGLSKKNKLVIVWRIAAAFVLFGALISTWYFLSNDETITPTQLSEKKEIVTPQKEVTDKEKAVESVTKSNNSNIAQASKSENRKKRTVNSVIKRETQNTINQTLAVDSTEPQRQLEENAVVAEPVLIAETVMQEKPIVIEFTLESISTKSTVTVEVVQTIEENSKLKKILETARDVKNGESDLNIRDAKNQLFALDFRKDKTKRN